MDWTMRIMGRRGWILALYCVSLLATFVYLLLWLRGIWGHREFWTAFALSTSFVTLAVAMNAWMDYKQRPIGRGFEVRKHEKD
jgi:hypothetical protein